MRAATAIASTAGLALLAAGCGGSTGSHVAQLGSTATAQGNGAISFSRCMRSHGVSKFPDPVSEGRLPKTSPHILGVSSSQFNAAEGACQHLLPTGEISGSFAGVSASVERCIVAGVCLPAVTHWLQNVELRFAGCMRSHGLPSWPDPTTDSQGRVDFHVSLSWAASPPEPADRECGRLTGAPIG